MNIITKQELKFMAKNRGIKEYKYMSYDDLMKTSKKNLENKLRKNVWRNLRKNLRKCLKKNNMMKNLKTSLVKKRINDIREEFNKSRYRFSKSKIDKITKNLYEIKKHNPPP